MACRPTRSASRGLPRGAARSAPLFCFGCRSPCRTRRTRAGGIDPQRVCAGPSPFPEEGAPERRGVLPSAARSFDRALPDGDPGARMHVVHGSTRNVEPGYLATPQDRVQPGRVAPRPRVHSSAGEMCHDRPTGPPRAPRCSRQDARWCHPPAVVPPRRAVVPPSRGAPTETRGGAALPRWVYPPRRGAGTAPGGRAGARLARKRRSAPPQRGSRRSRVLRAHRGRRRAPAGRGSRA